MLFFHKLPLQVFQNGKSWGLVCVKACTTWFSLLLLWEWKVLGILFYASI